MADKIFKNNKFNDYIELGKITIQGKPTSAGSSGAIFSNEEFIIPNVAEYEDLLIYPKGTLSSYCNLYIGTINNFTMNSYNRIWLSKLPNNTNSIRYTTHNTSYDVISMTLSNDMPINISIQGVGGSSASSYKDSDITIYFYGKKLGDIPR